MLDVEAETGLIKIRWDYMTIICKYKKTSNKRIFTLCYVNELGLRYVQLRYHGKAFLNMLYYAI